MRSLAIKFNVLLALITLSTQAAVPPLSDEMRESMASDIVSGVVAGTSSEIVKQGRGTTDRIYHVMLYVAEVAKGDITPKSMVEVTYWRANERPDDWCGDSGQNSVMKLGTSVRAYMYKGTNGEYSLLEPNGFDVLSNDMVEYYDAVHTSKAMKKALGSAEFHHMLNTAAYRCPGCFRFDVVGEKKDHLRKRSFMTNLNLVTGEIEVHKIN